MSYPGEPADGGTSGARLSSAGVLGASARRWNSALQAGGESWELDEVEAWQSSMAWTRPKFSRERVNAAGKVLVAWASTDEFDYDLFEEYQAALPVINNWRSSHGFPLNTLRRSLNRAATRIDPGCLTAQRIKRLSSISLKLKLRPSMKLSQMQDLGGCRAIMTSIPHVHTLAKFFHDETRMRHDLVHQDDYIAQPQPSGYRGIHLVWKYRSNQHTVYNDLKIEMQLRSAEQHAWATAVETAGTFLDQALKSSLGPADWLRFFSLMGSVVADREGTPLVPGTPTSRRDLLSQVSQYARQLDVANRLMTFSRALDVLEPQGDQGFDYFLLRIDPSTSRLRVNGYRTEQLEQATNDYLEAEKAIGKGGTTDAVLVSVESLASLRRAYPNYFADTRNFIGIVTDALREEKEPRLV